MNTTPYPRITPWVGRLIIANAMILLPVADGLHLPRAAGPARLRPGPRAGPAVDLHDLHVRARRAPPPAGQSCSCCSSSAPQSRAGWAAGRFIFYYLYCGVGAALLALGLSGLTAVSPFVGASGAVLGLGLAFAIFWPDAELILFPFPIPVRARILVAVLAGVDVFFAVLYRNQSDGIAHLAHIGGLVAGYLFFRVQALSHRSPTTASRPVERVVMVQSGVPESSRPAPEHRFGAAASTADPVAAEVDRVLDKISALGLSSLTAAERRFLDEVSRQKKQEH